MSVTLGQRKRRRCKKKRVRKSPKLEGALQGRPQVEKQIGLERRAQPNTAVSLTEREVKAFGGQKKKARRTVTPPGSVLDGGEKNRTPSK